MKKLKLKRLKAFTLVELIIVITILAILATIAFVSFQGYMKGARDSNRVTTITQINKGIENFYTTTGFVPNIDDQYGTGTLGGNGVTYVGYIGSSVSQLIKLNKIPLDPTSNTRYVYGIDYSKTKYQVGSILEDIQTNNSIIKQAYADAGLKAKVVGNYQGLLKYSGNLYNIPSLIITFSGALNQDLLASNTNYVIDKGDNLPYLAGSAKQLNTLTPTDVLKKLTNTGGLIVTGVTLATDAITWNTNSGVLQTTFGYDLDFVGQTVFGDKYFSDIELTTTSGGGGGTGINSRYPGCDTDDIVLSNGQVWSACNAGAIKAYNGQTLTLLDSTITGGPTTLQKEYMGAYYQWGRNKDVTNGPVTVGKVAVDNTTNFIAFNQPWGDPDDWITPGNHNLWGGSGSVTYTGANATNKILMQGPCETGYHVPTKDEWCSAMISINPSFVCNSTQQSGLLIRDTLKIPLAGARAGWGTGGTFINQGGVGAYWTSSPSPWDNQSHIVDFSGDNIWPPTGMDYKGSGYSVRCIKN